MILVDTSVWIDHLGTGNPRLSQLLDNCEVLAHPWVTGELALGHLRRSEEIITLLNSLPRAVLATDVEVLTLIERADLPGTGIGYVDAQLLAATKLTRDAQIWTNDRRLAVVAARVGVAAEASRQP